MDQSGNPKLVNNVHFSSGEFPNIIAFCERDETSRVMRNDEEAFEYKLHDKLVYLVKKRSTGFEIVEFEGNNILRTSADVTLENALIRALTFVETDKTRQEKRANIIFPINKTELKRAEAIMYHLGGYPRNFLPITAEFHFLTETFIDPEIEFLSYSYVPIEYVSWLREELKNAGLIGQDKKRTVWMYKK